MARQKSKSKIQDAKCRRLAAYLLAWFAANARDLPWRRTRDPYAVWVSEIMLQQTQVKTVIPFWERWMRELPAIASLAKATPEKIHKLWEGLGYYTRVRNLQRAAQVIEEKHGGRFPEKFDEVHELPGVGRYTAGAICSIAFNQPAPILDGNVIRVLTRIFGIAENPKAKETNEKLWKLAEDLVNRPAALVRRSSVREEAGTRKSRTSGNCSALNQSLMELGALICAPRNPQCSLCPAKKLCVAFAKNRILELPNLEKREAATARHFAAFVVEREGKFFVRQRPGETVNAHLWEFPNIEMAGGNASPAAAAKNIFGIQPTTLERLCAVKHSITRYRITLDAYRAGFQRGMTAVGNWKTLPELHDLAFASAHRRVLRAVSVDGRK